MLVAELANLISSKTRVKRDEHTVKMGIKSSVNTFVFAGVGKPTFAKAFVQHVYQDCCHQSLAIMAVIFHSICLVCNVCI